MKVTDPVSRQRALVVEDDARTRAVLSDFLVARGFACRACATVREGVTLLAEFQPHVLVLDLQLEDGCGTQLLAHLREASVLPRIVVVSGEARATDAFELAQMGARAFVSKPATPEALGRALDAATEEAPDLVPLARNMVGRVSVHDAQELLRRTMVQEALGRASGSRTGAARLLRVSRQLLQHMLRGVEHGKG